MSSACEHHDCDVLICGLGPTGLALALLLVRRGLTVIAVERDIDAHSLPRAAHIDHEIMRLFQELDVLARIIHRTARNRPRPPNTWARDFIAKNFIKQSIRIIVSDSNGLALIAHFS